jgi:hypothetical protein
VASSLRNIFSVKRVFYSSAVAVLVVASLVLMVELAQSHLPPNSLTHQCAPGAGVPAIEPIKRSDLDEKDFCFEQNLQLVDYIGVYPYVPELKPAVVTAVYNIFIVTVLISAVLMVPTGIIILYRHFKVLTNND